MADRVLGVDPSSRGVSKALGPWEAETRYRLAGWIGVVLTLAAVSDYALALIPLGFGSPEWEMSTVGAMTQGLPLFSLGLVGIWVAAGCLRRRWTLWLVGVAFLAAALCILGSLVLFLTDVPTALRATTGITQLGIEKLIAKTLLLGLLFGVSFVVFGLLALKQARGSSLRATAA